MNDPKIVTIKYRRNGHGSANGHSHREGYYVDVPNWDGGEVVEVESIAKYIESDCQCLMPIVVDETKSEYGLRLLKALANEIRSLKAEEKRKSELFKQRLVDNYNAKRGF